MENRTTRDFVTDRIFDVEKVNIMEQRTSRWLRAKKQAKHVPYCFDYSYITSEECEVN